MDWPHDSEGPSGADLGKVYRYESRAATVFRMLKTDPGPVLWSHAATDTWKRWLRQTAPSVGQDSGLVVILAQRAGETDGVFQQILNHEASFSSAENEISPVDEKTGLCRWPSGGKIRTERKPKTPAEKSGDAQGGGRGLRYLPFERTVFEDICDRFYIHTSISRVISRADVPLFSRAKVMMPRMDRKGEPGNTAIVYNCRSPNTWKDDLALTVTYFPDSRLAYAVIFGCTTETETQILNRLYSAKRHAFHPLILPGIFAEIEQRRMSEAVEKAIDDIEMAIYDLNNGTAAQEGLATEVNSSGSASGPRHMRRKAWLGTTFLRSRLEMWRAQLHKMVEHIDELASRVPSPYGNLFGKEPEVKEVNETVDEMEQSGVLIKDRLLALIEDINWQIGECTTRVEGMTMATQWAQGDTNVDIAIATQRDSKQMRSIALITMVFLPGTFFATLFSMSFFNWPPDNSSGSKPTVSRYIWIYFILTAIFTTVTLAIWWYFLVYRQRRAISTDTETQAIPEDEKPRRIGGFFGCWGIQTLIQRYQKQTIRIWEFIGHVLF